jgi:hypothetical protein
VSVIKLCPNSLRIAKQIVSWDSPKKGNLVNAASEHWAKLHRTVVAADCPQITFAPSAAPPKLPISSSSKSPAPKKSTKPITTTPKLSECELAGMCVHQGAGLRLYMFRNIVLATMKRMFPHKSKLREQLLDGFIVVVFHSSVLGHTDVGALPQSDQVVAMHIGMHYLSPYRPTFQQVTVDNASVHELGSLPRVFFKAFVLFPVHSHTNALSLGWLTKLCFTFQDPKLSKHMQGRSLCVLLP